jgi:large subunit ribosomal protein L24
LRPVVSVALKGPLLAPNRTVDANALASWLALRAVEQQSRQLDTMERLQREANVPPVATMPPPGTSNGEAVVPASGGETTSGLSDPNQAPPLPPAINILPAPKPRGPRVENHAAPVRAAAPKPSPPLLSPPLDLLGAQR